jgi:hypothetical protein
MADIIQIGTTVHDYTDASSVESGTGPETIDGSTSTYWSTFVQQFGDGNSSGNLNSKHTPVAAHDVIRVVFKAYVQCGTTSGASQNTASCSARLEVYRGGSWETVSGTSISASSSGDGSDNDSVDVDLTGLTLTGVSNVRGLANVSATQSGSGGSQWARARLYLIQAWEGATTTDPQVIFLI